MSEANAENERRTVLAGDVGGTKTLLGLFGASPGPAPMAGTERRLPSGGHPTFEAALAAYLAEVPAAEHALAVGLALAGPVRGQRCQITNLPWRFDAAALSASLGGRPVVLLNDFEAVGYGLSSLGADQVACIQPGEAEPGAPIALLGAGTGLGEALVLPEGQDGRTPLRIVAGEGGHADLAAQSPLEDAYLAWLRRWYGPHVSWERALSGAGIAAAYRFLAERHPDRVEPETREAMVEGDAAAVVTARADADPLCGEALDLFLGLYGAEAGNAALRVLARGGTYLAGGIAPRLLPRLAAPQGAFRRAFRAKGRFEALLADLPITVVLETRVGLLGAARAAAARLCR